MELILASASPRRLELIRRIVPAHTAHVSTVEETGSGHMPPFAIPPLFLAPPFPVPAEQDPRLWAWRKAADVISSNRTAIAPGTLVLGADTVVVGPGRLLNKPKDRDDAIEMLTMLRGIYHYVVTGFVILRATGDESETLHHEAVVSTVFMRDFSDVELEGYVATSEPYDKAGAYALQGEGGKLISSVEGCMTNVIGLPVCQVRRALTSHGMEVLPYPYGGFCEHCPLVSA
ncbi:MAG: Maf family protein [Chloroflexota bacterium]